MTTALRTLPPALLAHSLVLVSDVIDRTHVMVVAQLVAVDEVASIDKELTLADVDELAPTDCRRVTELLAEGLAVVDEELVTVPWYGAATAHGHLITVTAAGQQALTGTVAAEAGVAA